MGLLQKLFGKPSSTVPPRIVAHVAFDGAIRVLEAPVGEGWRIDESAREGDGFTVMVVKALHDGDPIPLALLAKVYTVAPDRDAPPAPASTDWRAAFGPLFSSIDAVEVHESRQLTMKASLDAVEAVVHGTSADHGVPLRIRERRAVQGPEQFLVTAMGPLDAFTRHATEIDAWFSTAAFVPIGETR